MIIEIIIFCLTAFIAYSIYYQRHLQKRFKSLDIGSVPGVPLFGNFFKSTFQKQHFFYDLNDVYKAFPDDRYVMIIENTSPIVLIRDPELIKQITVKDFEHFTDHRPFFSEEHDPLFGGSMLMLKGDKWKDMRTTMSPAFTGSKMRQMVPFMEEISQNIVQYLKNEINNTSTGKCIDEVNVDDLIRRYTNDVILSVAFGLQVNSVKDKTNKMYVSGQRLATFTTWQRINMSIILGLPNFSKKIGLKVFPKHITDLFLDVVASTMDHREKNKIHRNDMIQLLMEASKGTLTANNNEEKEKDDVGFATTEEMLKKDHTRVRQWTNEELAAQAFIFYFAGFESSASVLCMTIHELALNTQVQDKLYAEAKKAHAETKEMSFDLVQKLKYLDMVINETLRKWSPALIMDRECIKPYVLPPARPGGRPYRVEQGNIVYNSVNSIHMDPKHYPDPELYDPERFSDENKDNIKPFTFMPFGMGPRNCIGSRFALLELKILMYNLILNFEIVKCSKTSDPLRLQPADFNIKAQGGTWVQFKARA